MEPMYMNMQPYLNQNGQMHYRPGCYSGLEAQPSMSYGCGPWGSNYGYAPPGAYHGCCNHAYIPPHFAWGSPYSHVPPHHCAGSYPHFPVQYMPPPPPYSVVEHPRYEYEKNVPAEHHCCGCSNHPLHQKEQRKVRIEEEEPERERRKNDSLVPLPFKNLSYPIVWLPPDYKDGGKVQNIEGRKDASRDVKVLENGNTLEQRPPFWNRLLPLDSNNVVSSKQRGDGEEKKRQDDGKQNIQFPFYWMPYKPDGTKQENREVKDVNAKPSLESKKNECQDDAKQNIQFPWYWIPYKPDDTKQENHEVKDVNAKPSLESEKNKRQDDGKQNIQFPWYWIPYKPEDMKQENHEVKDVNAKPSLESEKGSGGEQNLHVNRGNIGDRLASRVKYIPVKEAEQCSGKESSIIQEKGSGASVRDGIDNGEKKSDNVEKVSPTEGPRKKSPSPPKSSKLPPVCLRVDPLPRKKSANAKARSPSPPGDKQKMEVKANEERNIHSSTIEENVKEGKEMKTVVVVDGSSSPEISMNVNVETPENLPAKSRDVLSAKKEEEKPEEEHMVEKHTVKGQSEDIVPAGGENAESLRAEEVKTDSVKKCRKLSEEEAAVIIQSAYRRFAICRWEPLKKLKQIARVREQIADVKRLIQELELSSDIQGRAKQKNIIAETIMSLLLKLDIIQGLHPTIREVRKSVVKELVSLQEKLDTIIIENPENSPGQESAMRHDHEDSSIKSEDVVSSEGNEINPVDLQNQIDGGSNSECSELSNANVIEEAAHVNIEMEAADRSVDKDVKSAECPTIKDEDEKRNVALENNETSIAKEDSEAILLEPGSELLSLQDDSSARVTDSAPTDHDMLQGELAELPLGVVDDLGAAEPTDHDMLQGESAELPLGVLDDLGAAEPTDHDMVQGELAELPLGVLDDLGAAEPTNHDMVQGELAELPLGVLDDLGAAEITNHSAVEADTGKTDQLNQLEEASPIVQESHYEIADKEKYEAMEVNEASDSPLKGVELETKEADTVGSLENCKLGDEFGTEQEVDAKIGDARSESNECTARHLDNSIADMIEASDERELPTAGTCNDNKATSDELHENLGLTNSTMEQPLESWTEKEMSRQLLQEGNLEETNLINEHANTCNAVDVDGVDSSIAEPEVKGPEKEVVSKQDQESTTEEAVEKQAEHDENSTDPAAGDDVIASNRKLMEENERMRDMMEKLIKSGHEQLTAIESLSGRVKDLEKRLSRKKKLKVKQYRAPR